jgi:hypothetical protein
MANSNSIQPTGLRVSLGLMIYVKLIIGTPIMTQKQNEQPKQAKRISPELAEVLHMLKSLENRAMPRVGQSAN